MIRMTSLQRCAVLLLIISCLTNGYDISRPNHSTIPSTKPTMSRRSMMSIVGSAAMTTAATLSAPNDALAANPNNDATNASALKPDVINFPIQDFTVSIPANWKVTSNSSTDNKDKIKSTTSKRNRTPKIFSAIDLQSGSVLTVVEEQTCSAQEYAQSTNSCDLLLPPLKRIFSQDTIDKDISKLLIRHDDRDNTALQGTTKLDSYTLGSADTDANANANVLDLIATTILPSFGTYRDTMGIDRPNTIERRVKAKALVKSAIPQTSVEDGQELLVGGESTRILTLWLSAPKDEWQKPVMAIKLNKIWDSITVK